MPKRFHRILPKDISPLPKGGFEVSVGARKVPVDVSLDESEAFNGQLGRKERFMRFYSDPVDPERVIMMTLRRDPFDSSKFTFYSARGGDLNWVGYVDSTGLRGLFGKMSKGFEIKHIYLDPKYREKGMGRALLNAAKGLARMHGKDILKVYPSLEGRPFWEHVLSKKPGWVPWLKAPIRRKKTPLRKRIKRVLK